MDLCNSMRERLEGLRTKDGLKVVLTMMRRVNEELLTNLSRQDEMKRTVK